MNDIALLVPTLGRPQNAERLIDAWNATTEGRSDLWFLVDDDDPCRGDYLDVCRHSGAQVEIGRPARLVSWTNRAALDRMHRYEVFASWGDDHVPLDRFETPIMDAVDDAGGVAIIGTNDLVHGPAIPTACCVTSNIVRALGWMALPTLEHLACDLAWKALAVAAGCWRYLPDVRVEHRHPIVGKADWDPTYSVGNDGAVSARDHLAYDAWGQDGIEVDAAKVRALRS